MSLMHVNENWSLYRILTNIMIASINGQEVRPFPKNKRKEWNDWAIEVAFDISLDNTLVIMDTALNMVTNLMVANHKLAAAVKVHKPNNETIKEMIENLENINKHIKKYQRFKRALEIGQALADTVKNDMQTS